MKSSTRIIFVLFTIIAVAAVYIGWQLFGPTINPPEGNFLYIKTGATYNDVKDDLEQKGIISNKYFFEKIANYLDYEKMVKPGKYKLGKGMSLVSLIRMLRSGNQSPVNLVIVKLRTKEELARKIGNNFEPDSLAVISFLNNDDSLSKYDLDTNTVFTGIIPDTYTFTWNTPVSKIFKRLFSAQQKFWNKERETAAAALGLTKKQVYILASIVEEETNMTDDKGKIASVYLNRLRRGMKLAADPTVKFALRDFGLKRIYFKDLAFPSAYNTYQNTGLPPGPICTPSIKTIDAVLQQPPTNYLFFVARADFSGYSNFSTTFEEHKRYAAAYQQALDSVILKKQSGKNENP